MKQIVLVDYSAIEKAFSVVDAMERNRASGKDQLQSEAKIWEGQVSEIWTSLKDAIKDGYMLGKEKIKDQIDRIMVSIDELMNTATSWRDEAYNRLRQNIQSFIKTAVDNVIKFLPQSIELGGKQIPISKVGYSQKVMMGGTLKASVLEAVEFTTEGELEFSVEYEVK
jgi:hypothetical protein